MDLKDLRGHVTIVLTAELRQLALAWLQTADYADDGESLVAWFQAEETPDNSVLDAAYSEAEALMVSVIVDAINGIFTQEVTRELDDSDLEAEEAVRTLSRY